MILQRNDAVHDPICSKFSLKFGLMSISVVMVVESSPETCKYGFAPQVYIRSLLVTILYGARCMFLAV